MMNDGWEKFFSKEINLFFNWWRDDKRNVPDKIEATSKGQFWLQGRFISKFSKFAMKGKRGGCA